MDWHCRIFDWICLAGRAGGRPVKIQAHRELLQAYLELYEENADTVDSVDNAGNVTMQECAEGALTGLELVRAIKVFAEGHELANKWQLVELCNKILA